MGLFKTYSVLLSLLRFVVSGSVSWTIGVKCNLVLIWKLWSSFDFADRGVGFQKKSQRSLMLVIRVYETIWVAGEGRLTLAAITYYLWSSMPKHAKHIYTIGRAGALLPRPFEPWLKFIPSFLLVNQAKPNIKIQFRVSLNMLYSEMNSVFACRKRRHLRP